MQKLIHCFYKHEKGCYYYVHVWLLQLITKTCLPNVKKENPIPHPHVKKTFRILMNERRDYKNDEGKRIMGRLVENHW